ncbi:hypothetical protein QCE63_07360 [Caballeronia sp. LZ065]|uniref:YncE family protein n=1 Tax=Caballeronia sp. LZ065 TaxID=3038571 RepID=UPI0028626E5E|nr:hypothetical protein [Caballeronia sp. LZ065]MDR5779247.1 hypothetical protein [Caballeronia sp. LZ065]
MSYGFKSAVISASVASLVALVGFPDSCEAASRSTPNFIPETTLPAGGNPNGIVALDKDAIFVATTATNQSGVEVAKVLIFGKIDHGYRQTGTVRLKADDHAQGMSITPDKTTLVVALEKSGVALVDVHDALAGKATPSFVDQSNGGAFARPGTFGTAVTPDGKYAFVANEDGKLTPTSGSGYIGLIALDKQRDGRTQGKPVGFIPVVGNTLADVSVSPDGQRAYATTEIVSAGNKTLSGTDNAALVSTQCVQGNPQNPRPNGALNVIDVAKAIEGAATPGTAPTVISNAVVTSVAAACSPVRVEETQDGSSVWVVARGSNELLQFDRATLAVDPDHALLQTVASNGLSPVALYLDPARPRLMVTNSDRYGTSTTRGANPPINQVNLSVFDVSAPHAELVQTLPTGQFPRDIATLDNERTVFVTDYTSFTVSVFRQTDESSDPGDTDISPFGIFSAHPERR